MKITFKLTKEQLDRAKEISAAIAAEKEEESSQVFWCGNLLGYQGHSFSFNKNQFLQLLDNRVIRYIGQRYPLVQDGGLQTLTKIAGFNDPFPEYDTPKSLQKEWTQKRLKAIQSLQVTDYQTSDKNLSWWETTEDKAIRLLKAGHVTFDMVKAAVKAAEERRPTNAEWVYLSVLKNYVPAKPGTPAYRRAMAEGTHHWVGLAARYIEYHVLM